MSRSQRFTFTEKPDTFGIIDTVPQLSFTLINYDNSVNVSGLLDTGSSVNIIPYDIGLQLGEIWEEQSTSVMLAGNLAPVEAKGLILSAQINDFSPVRLVFAWSRANDIPLLLGRMNFFLEFDVCFYTALKEFELTQK